jgi:hypothetical protein
MKYLISLVAAVTFAVTSQAQEHHLLNVSTRARIHGYMDNMYAGFIVTGNAPKRILVRALGPSLPVANALPDPMIAVADGTGRVIAFNNDWQSPDNAVTAAELTARGLAPSNQKEAALIITVLPGQYTALLSSYVTPISALALVEVYDLDVDGDHIAQLSTRGHVFTGDSVMIAGAIVSEPTNVLIRAIGPSLAAFGVPDTLQDPELFLYDANGNVLAYNDNNTGGPYAPSDSRESAITYTVPAGNFTALVRGVNSSVGTALVEIYSL